MEVFSGYKEIQQRNVHAEVITLFIDEVLKTAGKQYHELMLWRSVAAPVRIPGLRIGISVTKGLCFALDIPLNRRGNAGSNDRWHLSEITYDKEVLFCPMIDARRMEVFTAVFDGRGNKIKPTSAEIIDENSFADLLKTNKILFFGDGAAKCTRSIGSDPNAQIITEFQNSARYLTKIATEKYLAKGF